MHQGGANLLKMINQIMDLTKISAGRYDLRKVAVDAGSMMWLARESFSSPRRRPKASPSMPTIAPPGW